VCVLETSIAAEKLPLPPRDGLLKKSCRDAMAYKLAAAAMVFKKMFQISLPRLYWTKNIGTRPSDSFSLRVFHL
jgi:hypothetical protein